MIAGPGSLYSIFSKAKCRDLGLMTYTLFFFDITALSIIYKAFLIVPV